MIDVGHLTANLQFYMAVLARTSGIIIAAPIIGSSEVPKLVKVAMIVVFTIVIAPTANAEGFAPCNDMISFATVAASELAVGLAISFIALLSFGSLQMAGELVGRQMSFAVAQTADPMFNSQTSIISRFNVLMASLLLLSFDGHHWFLQALSDSFKRIPVGGFHWNNRITGLNVDVFSSVYYAGLRLAAPLVCGFLLITVAVGILARIAPQLNVMMLGITLRIGAGLIALGMFLPFFMTFCRRLLFSMRSDMYTLIEVMRG